MQIKWLVSVWNATLGCTEVNKQRLSSATSNNGNNLNANSHRDTHESKEPQRSIMPTYILFLGQLSKVTSLRIAPNIIFIKVSTTVLTKEEKLTRVNGYHMFYFITSPYVLLHYFTICDTLRNFVSFVQFHQREKHPWRSVTFSIVAGFKLKVTLLHSCFSRFLDCTNGTKLRNASYMTK